MPCPGSGQRAALAPGFFGLLAHADAPSSRRTACSGRGPGPGHLTYRRCPAAPAPCLEPLVATGAAKARLLPPRWLCQRGRPLTLPCARRCSSRACHGDADSSRARRMPSPIPHGASGLREERTAAKVIMTGHLETPQSARSWCRILGPPPYRRLTQPPRAGVAGATGQHGAVLDYCVGGLWQ